MRVNSEAERMQLKWSSKLAQRVTVNFYRNQTQQFTASNDDSAFYPLWKGQGFQAELKSVAVVMANWPHGQLAMLP